MNNNEIVIYKSNELAASIEVKLENETVWLSLNQISELFERDKSVISRHISNIFKDGELVKKLVVAKNATTALDGKIYQVDYYNLDVIISVGYRVKSKIGTQFRIWATQIIKDYLLKGYAINYRVDKIERKLIEHDKKFDLLIRTNLPPNEGIFYDGQIFDAWQFISGIIKEAKQSIILIDNYIDDTVLTILSKRKVDITTTIYTAKIDKQLMLDLEKHNLQYPKIDIKVFKQSHDRFLIIDNKTVYHMGASLKDLGKKWFAFSKINIDAKEMICKLQSTDYTNPCTNSR
jgi:Virulence protein RhuM family